MFAEPLPTELNMPEGVTPISRDLFELHMTLMAICAVIALLVYGILTFIIIRYRRSKGAEAAGFSGNRKLEITWTIVPFLILVSMAVPATIVLQDMYDYEDADVTIKITGYQWKWEYQYLDYGIQFFSNLSTPLAQINGTASRGPHYLREVDRPLVVPVGHKVRFLVTSNDVIHSWWVPELGVKRDAIPGYLHETWARISTPGTYRGQCAELCGVNHGFMPIVVEAVSEAEFKQWLTGQSKTSDSGAGSSGEWTMDAALSMGRGLYDRNCAACHQQDGSGIEPMFPALRESSVVVGASVDRHIDLVLHGVPGSAMQAYAAQLSDTELAAIITYERNAWDNNTGDLVTPADIKAQRERVASKQP